MWRHPDKFGDHMSCDGRDSVFNLSLDHTFDQRVL